MELALKLASIFFTMILVDNYVLAKFLEMCIRDSCWVSPFSSRRTRISAPVFF